MKLSEFDYTLPEELIAQYPLKERDGSRLMVLERASQKIYEKKFVDIINYLSKGDTIVLNDAKVIPARLLGKKDTGANVELFLLEKIKEDVYNVLAKPSKRLKIGTKVVFRDGIEATVLENADFGKIVRFSAGDEKLKAIGQTPLPPYIKREPEKLDEERYQTVYAKADGATASPTAGLHFTKELLGDIKAKGINISYVTLDVSYGTFAPVLEEDIENHKMHKEYFRMPRETADVVNETKKRGNKVVAVGTTATRVLETCANVILRREAPKDLKKDSSLPSAAQNDIRMSESQDDMIEGYTDIFIYPGYKFKAVDALLTNFHIPQSTLLMLVSAFAGRESVLEAYKKAVEAKFRFFSYGDCMLII
jgi:S-adenosylmethionine:tRNA ribosyltransferase-isomerase